VTSHVEAVNWLSSHSLISAFGTAGVIALIFAETGVLIGIFLPGDTLLVTAGIAAGGGFPGVKPPLVALLIGCPIAAIAGAQFGYWLGKRAGPRLFAKADARVFHPEYVERTTKFLDRFGIARAIVLARFAPLVRTVLNPLAGLSGVPQRTFVVWNVIGGLIWTEGIVSLGYALGHRVAGIDKYVLPVLAVVVVVSVLSVVFEGRRTRRGRRPADGEPADGEPADGEPAD
jgi:membrane-associated protein